MIYQRLEERETALIRRYNDEHLSEDRADELLEEIAGVQYLMMCWKQSGKETNDATADSLPATTAGSGKDSSCPSS